MSGVRRCVAALALALATGWGGAVRAETRRVPTLEHPTIQACIDSAVDGDECVVAPGTYNETIDLLGKAITVRSSAGSHVTIIDGTGFNDSVVKCITHEGPDTVLDGFTITGGTRGRLCFLKPLLTCGGGMLNLSDATVVRCTFTGNGAALGGGMYNGGSDSSVIGCRFLRNAAGTGGGVCNQYSNAKLTNCEFSGNIAFHGGGIANTWGSDSAVINSTFTGNRANEYGGGIYNYASLLTVTNCTLSRNESDVGGAMFNTEGAVLWLSGCILWRNNFGELANFSPYTSATIVYSAYSNIYGGLPSGTIDDGGNIDADPMFMRSPGDGGDGWGDDIYTRDVDEGANDDFGDLRLLVGSVAINAGDPDYTPAGASAAALDGKPRVLCGRVDMGAYEHGMAGDANCDELLDLTDYHTWPKCMTGPASETPLAPACYAFDVAPDGLLDLSDFGTFARLLAQP